MEFPVDVLVGVSQEALDSSAQNYMKELLYSNPDSPQYLTLEDRTQVDPHTPIHTPIHTPTNTHQSIYLSDL